MVAPFFGPHFFFAQVVFVVFVVLCIVVSVYFSNLMWDSFCFLFVLFRFVFVFSSLFVSSFFHSGRRFFCLCLFNVFLHCSLFLVFCSVLFRPSFLGSCWCGCLGYLCGIFLFVCMFVAWLLSLSLLLLLLLLLSSLSWSSS